MTKKHLIALADAIRVHNRINGNTTSAFATIHVATLADFCQSQNPNFNRSRWLDYIASKCGKNGGKI
jgi:hypothetical protein